MAAGQNELRRDMMSKPVMKTDIAIDWAGKTTRIMYIYATAEALADIARFGDVEEAPYGQHLLRVDARYDFDDVVAYIENYGKDAE